MTCEMADTLGKSVLGKMFENTSTARISKYPMLYASGQCHGGLVKYSVEGCSPGVTVKPIAVSGRVD